VNPFSKPKLRTDADLEKPVGDAGGILEVFSVRDRVKSEPGHDGQARSSRNRHIDSQDQIQRGLGEVLIWLGLGRLTWEKGRNDDLRMLSGGMHKTDPNCRLYANAMRSHWVDPHYKVPQ
jgi:hypothetical protein